MVGDRAEQAYRRSGALEKRRRLVEARGILLRGEPHRKQVPFRNKHRATTTDRDFWRPVANGLATSRMLMNAILRVVCSNPHSFGPRVSQARLEAIYARF